VPDLQVFRDQFGLGSEVVVEAFLGDAGFLDDGVNAGGRDAIVVEQDGGGIQ